MSCRGQNTAVADQHPVGLSSRRRGAGAAVVRRAQADAERRQADVDAETAMHRAEHDRQQAEREAEQAHRAAMRAAIFAVSYLLRDDRDWLNSPFTPERAAAWIRALGADRGSRSKKQAALVQRALDFEAAGLVPEQVAPFQGRGSAQGYGPVKRIPNASVIRGYLDRGMTAQTAGDYWELGIPARAAQRWFAGGVEPDEAKRWVVSGRWTRTADIPTALAYRAAGHDPRLAWTLHEQHRSPDHFDELRALGLAVDPNVWAAAELSVETVRQWLAAGWPGEAGPSELRAWIATDLPVADAVRLHAAGITSEIIAAVAELGLTTDELLSLHGLRDRVPAPPEDDAEWRVRFGGYADAWRRTGLDFETASDWQAHEFSPEDALACEQAGVGAELAEYLVDMFELNVPQLLAWHAAR